MNNLLFEFAKLNNSESAFLLHGEWGSGKTYFINKVFLPAIKAKNKYYVSLFGVSNIDQIYNQLIVQKFIGKQSGKILRLSVGLGTMVAKSIANYIGEKAKVKSADIGVNISDIIPINDCVVIFDDLERISESADFSELLGQINNYFVSEPSIRVIFVADESKIVKNVFKEYKEKIIGFQSTLEIDVKKALKSILDDKKDKNFKNYLSSNINFIYEMIESFNTHNLRTIKYYFDILEFIYDKGMDSMISKKDLLFSIFILAVEEKANRISSTQDNKTIPYHVSRRKRHDTVNNADKEQEDHFNKYLTSTLRKKHKYDFDYYFYESIYNLIRFGNLDRSKINQEIEQLEHFKSQNRQSDLMKLVDTLRGYHFMTNEEYFATYSQFIDELAKSSKALAFDDIVITARLLYYLQRKSQLNVDAGKLIKEHLLNRLEEIQGEDIEYYPSLVLSRLDREIGEIQRQDPELAQKLDRMLKNLRTEYLKQESKKKIDNADFTEISEYHFRVFLSTASTDEVISIIDRIKAKKGKLDEFTRKMETTFKMPVSSLDDILKDDEKNRLRILRDELVKYQEGLILIENIWIGEIVNAINGVIGKQCMEQTSHQASQCVGPVI